MKIFDEILLKHTDIQTCREFYVVNKDISITVDQKENKIVMWAFNYTADRFVNLATKFQCSVGLIHKLINEKIVI